MPEERLQKILAAAGVASRRASEALIASGRVRVNGKVAAIGDQADGRTAQIEVDGILVGVGAARTYVALHKPAGVTSTTRDRHADTTVLDLVPTALTPDGTRLYPVGRLDLDSEGLLLLTNDGAWAEHVLHPRFGVQREYAVGLEHPLDRDQVALLRAGIQLDEGLATLAAPLRPATAIETKTLADLLHPPPHPDIVWYRAVLTQGWKRQLRRMFAAAGTPVLRLVRVRIGTVRLDRLPTGRARLLRAPEVRQLGAGQVGSAQRHLGPSTVGAPSPAGGSLAARGGASRSAGTGRGGEGDTGRGAGGGTGTGGSRPKPKPVQQKGAPGSSGPRKPAPKPKQAEANGDAPDAAKGLHRRKGERLRSRTGSPPKPIAKRPESHRHESPRPRRED